MGLRNVAGFARGLLAVACGDAAAAGDDSSILAIGRDPAVVYVQRAGAPLPPVGFDGAIERLARQHDRLPCWLQRGAAPLAVVRLREAGAVQPAGKPVARLCVPRSEEKQSDSQYIILIPC